jgi:D-alanine-D-alanine ligase
MRVTVLTGGSTHERDVALAGAAQVVAALRATGHTVQVFDTARGPVDRAAEADALPATVGRTPPEADHLAALAAQERTVRFADHDAIREADVVFLVLHGPEGEGGAVQAQLDAVGVPYTGSDPEGSRLAMDKDEAKHRMRAAGIPTPEWIMWPDAPDATFTAAAVDLLGLPLIVKPSKAGSTVGLSVVHHHDDLADAVARARAVDDAVLLERFLPGRELTVGVLDDAALGVGEIVPRHEVFDYECKYTPELTDEIFPADVPAATADHLRALALATHRALGLRDFSRVDFRLDDGGAPQCLEVNTLPGLTAASLLPQSAAVAGIAFPELCGRLVQLALRRREHRNKVRESGEL